MEITCAQVRQEVSNYMEADMTVMLRALVEAHVAKCNGCKAVYDGVRNIIKLVSGSEVIELPEGFSRRLFAKLSNA